jgi:hypothetical protein
MGGAMFYIIITSISLLGLAIGWGFAFDVYKKSKVLIHLPTRKLRDLYYACSVIKADNIATWYENVVIKQAVIDLLNANGEEL